MNKYIGFGEAVKETVRILRLHFPKVIALILLIMLPLSVIYGIIGEVALSNGEIEQIYELAADPETESSVLSAAINQAMPSILPVLLMEMIVALLSLAFPVALVRLTLDEGRHGALTLNYSVGDIYVVNVEPNEVHDVGSAAFYFGNALRLMPRVALCALCGGIIVMAGFMLMVVPGFIALIVAGVSIFYVALTGSTAFRGFFGAGRMILKRPVILGAFLAGTGVSFFTSVLLGSLLSLIPSPEGWTTVFSAGITAVGTCLSSVVTAFSTILVTCLMVNTLDVNGFKYDENGFLVGQ